MSALLETFGAAAGIGGLGLGVLMIVFRDVIRKNIFPTLQQQHAFHILRLIIVLTFAIAALGIVAWIYRGDSNHAEIRPRQATEPQEEQINRYSLETSPGVMLTYPKGWYEVPAGTGSPQILPAPDSVEGKLGLQVTISVSSMRREGIEQESKSKLQQSEGTEFLESKDHLAMIRGSLTEMVDYLKESFEWLGERRIDLPVYSETTRTPRRRTTTAAWIVDYLRLEEHHRELHFLESGRPNIPNNSEFSMVEVSCVAPKSNFSQVADSCDRILGSVIVSSANYFAD